MSQCVFSWRIGAPILGLGLTGFAVLVMAFPVRADVIVTSDQADVAARADSNRNSGTVTGTPTDPYLHIYKRASDGGDDQGFSAHDDGRVGFNVTTNSQGVVTITGSLHQGGGVSAFGEPSVGGAAELFATLQLTRSYVVSFADVTGAAGSGGEAFDEADFHSHSYAFLDFDGIQGQASSTDGSSFGSFDISNLLQGLVLAPGNYDLSAGAFGDASVDLGFAWYYGSVGDRFTITLDPVVPAVAVPEPSSLALLALGVGTLAGWRRWKKRTATA